MNPHADAIAMLKDQINDLKWMVENEFVKEVAEEIQRRIFNAERTVMFLEGRDE